MRPNYARIKTSESNWKREMPSVKLCCCRISAAPPPPEEKGRKRELEETMRLCMPKQNILTLKSKKSKIGCDKGGVYDPWKS